MGALSEAFAPADEKQAILDRRLDQATQAFHRGDARAADSIVQNALTRLGGSAAAHAVVGQGLTQRGRPAEALAVLESGLKAAGANAGPTLWGALAQAARQAKNSVRADEAEREATARAEAILQSEAGTGLRRTPPEKARAVERLIEAGLYFHEYAKNTPRALVAWRAALALFPDRPDLLNTVGYTLADEGTTPAEWNEALRLTRRATQAAPEDGMIRDSYGWALFKTGDLAAARRVLREAADQAPGTAEIQYHLGVVYAKLGRVDQADAAFVRALRLKPGYEDAQRARAALPQAPTAPAASAVPAAR